VVFVVSGQSLLSGLRGLLDVTESVCELPPLHAHPWKKLEKRLKC
jgi:hypothetical protein